MTDLSPMVGTVVQVITESWRTMGSKGGPYGFCVTGTLLRDFDIDGNVDGETEDVFRITGVEACLSFRASAVHHVEMAVNPPTLVLKS